MKNFTYYQPTTVAMALPLLDAQWGKSELLGGGTDLPRPAKELRLSSRIRWSASTDLSGNFRKIVRQVSAGEFPAVGDDRRRRDD